MKLSCEVRNSLSIFHYNFSNFPFCKACQETTVTTHVCHHCLVTCKGNKELKNKEEKTKKLVSGAVRKLDECFHSLPTPLRSIVVDYLIGSVLDMDKSFLHFTQILDGFVNFVSFQRETTNILYDFYLFCQLFDYWNNRFNSGCKHVAVYVHQEQLFVEILCRETNLYELLFQFLNDFSKLKLHLQLEAADHDCHELMCLLKH